MSESINWCNLKKNVKHIGEVSTSRVDGSPTGAEILKSTNAVTGEVRDTLDGITAKMTAKADAVNSENFTNFTSKKNAEFEEFIAEKNSEFCDFVRDAGVSGKVAIGIITNQRLLATAHPLFGGGETISDLRDDINKNSDNIDSVGNLSQRNSSAIVNNQRFISAAHPLFGGDANDGVDIFALTHTSNFDRAFMLTSAFASDKKLSVLATATKTDFVNYHSEKTDVNLVKAETTIDGLSSLIVDNISENEKGERTLYCNVGVPLSGDDLSRQALQRLDRIVIIPEGTSIFGYGKDLLDKFVAFAINAKANGVKNIDIGIWSSIKMSALLTQGTPLSKMPSQGVGFYMFDFGEIAQKVRMKKNQGNVIASAIYSGAIQDYVLTSGAFKENPQYDPKKESFVLFGSYTRPDVHVSQTNQIDILKKLETVVDKTKYNILFKGHPSEISVNQWIDTHHHETSASYFASFPYEIWSVVGEGTHKYSYEGSEHYLYMPAAASEIYAVFSTSLYIENTSTVGLLFGYNEVTDTGGGNYVINSTPHSSSVSSKAAYEDWKELTGATSPFEMVYDFINK